MARYCAAKYEREYLELASMSSAALGPPDEEVAEEGISRSLLAADKPWFCSHTNFCVWRSWALLTRRKRALRARKASSNTTRFSTKLKRLSIFNTNGFKGFA